MPSGGATGLARWTLSSGAEPGLGTVRPAAGCVGRRTDRQPPPVRRGVPWLP